MDWLANALRQHPELALFLTLAGDDPVVGRHVLRMHPGVLLGVCAYGVTYALANVLLALWGSVVVVLMTR